MRLPIVRDNHMEAASTMLAGVEATVGHLDPVDHLLAYRPDLFGRAFQAAHEDVNARDSDWTAGERELFAAFTSSLNQCPF